MPDIANAEMVCALAKLSMDEREALFDHVVRYETLQSIADRLGYTHAGVATIIDRARRKLRRELGVDA